MIFLRNKFDTFGFAESCLHTVLFTSKKHRVFVFHQCVLCSVLMGAVCGLGTAKVNYCTGRGFWLHRIIA